MLLVQMDIFYTMSVLSNLIKKEINNNNFFFKYIIR